MYTCVYVYIYIYIYTHTRRDKHGESSGVRCPGQLGRPPHRCLAGPLAADEDRHQTAMYIDETLSLSTYIYIYIHTEGAASADVPLSRPRSSDEKRRAYRQADWHIGSRAGAEAAHAQEWGDVSVDLAALKSPRSPRRETRSRARSRRALGKSTKQQAHEHIRCGQGHVFPFFLKCKLVPSRRCGGRQNRPQPLRDLCQDPARSVRSANKGHSPWRLTRID